MSVLCAPHAKPTPEQNHGDTVIMHGLCDIGVLPVA